MSTTTAHIWQSSESYRWNTGDILGRGATAVVYKARHLTTGEECAVKLFHDRVSQHYAAVPHRELQLLQRLKHRNVISIYDIQREITSNNYVLAMEFCDGSSLYSMLDQPKYFYGLPEEEFLIVLYDIASGMKYLRQQEIIHRDIKPGNIMRKIDENGRSIYKLTDFGAARKLEEEETFTSIYGTEEYLDPNMYERAVLRRNRSQDFGAVVDLWSLGVTIFHTATGHLPFQPYGGRKNTETMYMITTQKASGVISGIQRTENGEIEWKRDLPHTCLLSPFLKSIVTPIMAGLLESDTRLRWTFEQFFETVQSLKEMIAIKLFNCSAGSNNKMYINKMDRFAKCQELIAKETEIMASEQLILYYNREISEVIDMTAEIQNWPKNVLNGQLYLYQRERLDQQRLNFPEIPPIPQFFSSNPISYEKDSYVAHKMSAIAHLTVRYVTLSIQEQELMQLAEISLRDYIFRLTSHINNTIPDMKRLLEEHNKRQNMFYGVYPSFLGHLEVLLPLLKDNQDMAAIVRDKYQKMHNIVSDVNPREVLKKAENRSEECKVYMDVLMNKIYEQEKDAISHCVGCLQEENCTLKADHLCSKIQEISAAFSKDRKQKTLSPEADYVHEADRMRIQDLCVQLVSLLQGHCLRNLSRTYSVVGKQIGLLLKNVQRTKKVEQNISSVNDCREKLSNRIDKMDRECLSLSEQAKEGMRTHIKGGFSLPVQLQASARALSGKTQTSQLTSQDTSQAFKDSALGSSTGLSSVGSSTGERLFER
ncbi:serine/threonine-protein kinase TBK1-like isoform X3 [Ostrea edulis]|nr:serine/threonine-protein kinase TBK1-like isoform X3 [Ostrea edulis]